MKKKMSRRLKLFGTFRFSLLLESCEVQLCVLQQLDHHLSDVAIQIMILQCGEGQEARAGYDVNAVRGTA